MVGLGSIGRESPAGPSGPSATIRKKGGLVMDIYQKHGYKDRKDYLESLALEFGLPKRVVFMAANMLGKNEDFDGLLTTLEDATW
jgi:hypothetical protein